MSRIGNKPIKLDESVTVTVNDEYINIKGSKGELKTLYSKKHVKIEVKDQQVNISANTTAKQDRERQGLYRALLANNVVGVKDGYIKELEIHGIGNKVQAKGKDLEFNLGFSHTIIFKAVEGIEYKIESPLKLQVVGIDKELVGQIAANIRSLKSPDPYKNKGIRYKGEALIKKQGKSIKK